MKPSSEPQPPPAALIMRGDDWDLIMTPQGSAIAQGDGDPIVLQSMN